MKNIKNGVQIKIKFIRILILILLFTSSIKSQDIETAPLIRLDEIKPSYDEEVIQLDKFDEFNETTNLKDNLIESKSSFATISLLNKITAEVETIQINLKQEYLHEELKIYAIDCYNSKPLEKKETAVYLNVYIEKSNAKIFNGWMIKSLPSISSMEHPIYDLWVDGCDKL